MHIFRRTSTIKEIKYRIFEIFRPLLEIPQLQKINQKGKTLTDAQYLQKEYNYAFLDPETGQYDW